MRFCRETTHSEHKAPPSQYVTGGTQVLPSLGTSGDASSSCHAATLGGSQINNPSVGPSIHACDSTSSGYQCHWEAQGVDKYTAAPTNRRVPAGRPVNRRGKVQAATPWPHSPLSHHKKTKKVLCFLWRSQIRGGCCPGKLRPVWVYFSPIIACHHKYVLVFRA